MVVETKNFKERTEIYGGDAADVALAHELIDLVTDARARYPEDVREFLERWGKPPPVDEAAQRAKLAPLRSGDFREGWSSSRLAAHGMDWRKRAVDRGEARLRVVETNIHLSNGRC